MYYERWEDIPEKHYQVIYADPPWPFRDKMKGHSFSLDHEYETQPIEWIKGLGVRNITDSSAVLLMWAVSSMLPEAFEVMRAWGFKPVTVAFVWSKLTSKGKKVTNLGRWTMGNVELCLLGRKGKMQRAVKNVKQLVEAERREHSRKPDEVRSRAEMLFGDVPRIELFARGTTDGWDQFGNDPTYNPERV
jgi:site-specific DNA-methyltransferase (adenine-specific)